MKAENLRCEYLCNPIGIDEIRPRFYWNCIEGKKQTAYQIVARRVVPDKDDGEIIWDTGKVSSSSMTHIPYEGKDLRSRDNIRWSVTLWNEEDNPGEPAEAWFEMGLLKEEDWSAKFISGNYKPSKNVRYPVDYFRKEITIEPDKKICRARVYATAFGVYSIKINDSVLEDFVLAPGITDYRKRLQYQTFDITDLISGSKLDIELSLADGWYRGSSAAYGVTNVYGNRTSVLAQIEISYSDGSTEIIGTDSSWNWSNDGPIRFADLKDGEIYDAGKAPSFCDKAREVLFEKSVKATRLVASNNVPVKYHEHFKAKRLTAADGTTVYDFGQNIAGVIQFKVKAKKGQKIKLICGEILNEKGRVNLSNIQEQKPASGWTQFSLIKKLTTNSVKGASIGTPLQQVEFTASGNEDFYRSQFTVFGFRYAEILGDFEIDESDIEAVAIYSDLRQTGWFSCSNPLINKLHENTLWSMKGNFLDIPTDCPTRERLGWTGDGQIFFNTGSYMMDIAPFMKKWMYDMEDAKYKNGLVPAVFPYEGVEMMYKATGSSVGWADIIYLLPYRYYKKYGDKQILIEHWDMIKGYVNYLVKNLGMKDKKEAKDNPYNEYTYEKGVHLGEWLEPEEFRDKEYGVKAKHTEECTAYLYLAMNTIAEIAKVLGHDDYEKLCQKYAVGAKQAYKYLIVDKGGLDTKRQAKLVRPLALDILDDEDKRQAEENLINAVEGYNYCVGTGFLSTPFILPVLTASRNSQTAYNILENEKKPGWLAEVKAGATTVWENWEGDLSQNHYSPGAVCEWLYNTVAGINVDGENHFIIKPVPGGKLSFASASYESIYGKVSCRWKLDGDCYKYEIEIPANTTATIILPDGRKSTLGSGAYKL